MFSIAISTLIGREQMMSTSNLVFERSEDGLNWFPESEERVRRVLAGAYRDVDAIIEFMADGGIATTGFARYRRAEQEKP